MLPREISVEHWPDQTTFDLPVRPLGRLRWVGLVPIVSGVAFTVVPLAMFWPMFRQTAHAGTGLFHWAFLLPFAIFIPFALSPVGIGVFLLAGRCRLVVTRDRITAREIAGPIFWRRKARLKNILRIEVGGAAQTANGSPPRTFPGVGFLRVPRLKSTMRRCPRTMSRRVAAI